MLELWPVAPRLTRQSGGLTDERSYRMIRTMNPSYTLALSNSVRQTGSLSRIVVDHPAAKAVIFPHGAHLAEWQPAGHKPVLYMSPNSQFAPMKPIRGGVPVCLPWFGPNAAKPETPPHGFARLLEWSVTGVTESDSGVEVHLQLNSNQAPEAMRVGDFIADLRFSIGKELRMTLTMKNTGSSPLTFEEALHTYYVVSDVRNISVSGLQGVEYISKSEGGVRKTDDQPAIKFTGETDRGYLNTESTCTIDDPGLKRKIIVAKTNSKTTVVWNPFVKRATELTDIGADNWTGFVCVETANVMENKITLPAGQTHEMAAHVRVEGNS